MTAIELRHLRAFVAVADDLHFGRMAERLELSQSAVSRTIVDLEGIAGTRLLDRSQHTVGLTGAGRALLPVARGLLGELDEALRHAREPEARTPVLGILGSSGHAYLPDLQGELAIRGAPDLRVRQIGLEEGFEPLGTGVDVGIYPLPLVAPAGLEFAVLGHSNPYVAVKAGHPPGPVALSALLEQPPILPRAHSVWWDDLRLVARGHDHGQRLVAGPEADSLYAALMLVAAGYGWTPSAARSDFPLWDGVEVRPLVGVERVRIAAVWRRSTSQARLLSDALVAIAL
jgi:DNA-binding transcriptional LysR family regulator